MVLQLVETLKLHKDKVWDIDCSKGLLASASGDRSVKIVQLGPSGSNCKVLEELDDNTHKKSVRSVAWRPNSKMLAAGSFDSTISIWAPEESDENLNLSMELLAVIEGHENEVKSVAWSQDGCYLATCSRDKSVWIWESDEMGEEYECVSVLQEHSQDVKHVVWHGSQNILASSSYDDTIRIWREFDEEWECSAILTGHEGTVWCCDFETTSSQDSVRLCSCSDDSTIKIWRYNGLDDTNEEDWTCERTLPNVHISQVYGVAWGPDGFIASVGSDGNFAVYKEMDDGTWCVTAKQRQAHDVFEINTVKWIKLKDDKTALATGGDDGSVKIWVLDQ